MAPRAVHRWAGWACVLALPWLGLAVAQPVYRCGPDGSTYTQAPCPAGTGHEVDVADPRNAAQWSEAADVAQRAAEAGQRMERERLHNEAARAQVGAARLDAPSPAKLTPLDQRETRRKVRRAVAPKAACVKRRGNAAPDCRPRCRCRPG